LSDICLEYFNVKEIEEEAERRIMIGGTIKRDGRGKQEEGKT
jgi:hypothetical protein